MAKFYVNEFRDERIFNCVKLQHGQCLVGLFKQCKTKGEGSFCGYYGVEYYLNTELYAWYIADDYARRRDSAKALSLVQVCDPPISYERIPIATHMWTEVISAENVAEAIFKFENHDWRQWSSLLDEIDATPVARCPKCGKWPQLSHTHMRSGYEYTQLECLSCKMYRKSIKGTNGAKEEWNAYIKKRFGYSDRIMEKLCDPAYKNLIDCIASPIKEGK